MFNHFTCAVSAVSSVHVHSVSSVRGLLMLSAILGAADAALWNRFHVSSLSATAAAALRSAVSCFITFCHSSCCSEVCGFMFHHFLPQQLLL